MSVIYNRKLHINLMLSGDYTQKPTKKFLPEPPENFILDKGPTLTSPKPEPPDGARLTGRRKPSSAGSFVS